MNLKERLLTLYALSQRGVGGERENAERILNRTLKSHNMTLEEFLNEQETKQLYWLRIESKQEGELLTQVIGKITNAPGAVSVSYLRGDRNSMGFHLTRGEIIAAKMLWEIYAKAFRAEKRKSKQKHNKENKYLLLSFIYKHNIFSSQKNPDKKSSDNLDFGLIAEQANDMADVKVHPELSNRLLENTK